MDNINYTLCYYTTFYIIINICIIFFTLYNTNDIITTIIIGVALLLYNIHAIQTTKIIMRIKKGKKMKL